MHRESRCSPASACSRGSGAGAASTEHGTRIESRMTTRTRSCGAAVVTIATVLATSAAGAHGVVGKRFFPATLAIEDPFVADELSLPTYSYRKLPASSDEPAARETELAFDYTKRIMPNLALGIGGTYLQVRPDEGDTQRGWDNLELGLKYQFHQDAATETVFSVGVDWDIGGSGSKRVGAESFSTVTPALFFGKGFGDLPESARMLRPLALTGQLGVSIPSRTSITSVDGEGETITERIPNNLVWGFALEYSIPYLQSFVQDMGWREPFNRMIPIVELNFSTALNRGGSGTTGTINPGLLWAGRSVQLGIEAVIPVNARSGSQVGVLAQLHFYLDDIFPDSLGRPLFGNAR